MAKNMNPVGSMLYPPADYFRRFKTDNRRLIDLPNQVSMIRLWQRIEQQARWRYWVPIQSPSRQNREEDT